MNRGLRIMNRVDALSLIKELMLVCETLRFAPIVSLKKSDKPGGWEVRVKWVSDSTEKGCFDKVIMERGLMAVEAADGYTTFYKPENRK